MEKLLLERMLADVSNAGRHVREDRITLCPTHVGNRWNGELMVVWRAPNGWDDGFPRAGLADAELRRDRVRAALTGSGDPESWASQLAWRNLCKLAPAAGRNPSAGLWRAQLPAGTELLQFEIELLRPKRILFMCGFNWIEAFPLEFSVERRHDSYVDLSGRLILPGRHTADVVVSKHPERKPDDLVVQDILAAFSSLTS